MLPQLPSIDSLGTIEEVKDYLYQFERTLNYLLGGKLGSKNIREIGGFLVTLDTFSSEDGFVGLTTAGDLRIWAGGDDPSSAPFRVYHDGDLYASSANLTGSIIIGSNDGQIGLTTEGSIRLWLGSAIPSLAPFRVHEDGSFYATDANLSGNITMTGGSIQWTEVNPPTPSDVGAIEENDPRLSQLSTLGQYLGDLSQGQITGLPGKLVNINSIGEYIGALSQGQVTGLSNRLTHITSTGVYTGTVGTDQLIAGSALIGSALIGELAANKITGGELTAVNQLTIGVFSDSHTSKSLRFNSGATLSTISDGIGGFAALRLSGNIIELQGSSVIRMVTNANGFVDFNNAEIRNFNGVAVFG